MATTAPVQWKIDECAAYFDRMRLRGWCHHAGSEIQKVEVVFPDFGVAVPVISFGQPSPDVAAGLGATAARARFEEWLPAPAEVLGHPFTMRFTLADGSVQLGEDALTNAAWGDPYFQSWENFIASLSQFESGAVLEVGSRARSAITRSHRIPKQLSYVGMDILAGPNVDVVGDAHELSSLFAGRKFVAIFSTSVFEHLLMPWKVALEMNKILEPGGIVYTSTHQTWPVHEEPWDFWRFSKTTWHALFNPATGFAVTEAVVGEPARIHACRTSTVTRDMPASPAYLGSACLAKKVSETTLSWPVPLSTAVASMYPAGNLEKPPTTNRA
jgi:hypothetical protein